MILYTVSIPYCIHIVNTCQGFFIDFWAQISILGTTQ